MGAGQERVADGAVTGRFALLFGQLDYAFTEARMATDIDKLQGDWYVTALEIGGQAGGVPITGEQMIVVKSDRFESLGMGATYKGTVKLGKEGGVTTIDLIFTAGPEKGNVNRGIYKLAGTKWTLLLNTRTGPRPKKFGVKLGTGHVLEELSRTPVTTFTRLEQQ